MGLIPAGAARAVQPDDAEADIDPHAEVFAEDLYPSAAKCGACHQQIYQEWASSNHAYASISPMFHKFEQRINDLAQGTVSYFCMRCHGTVGTTLNEPREMPLWERSLVSREGVTCITCHRVAEEYGKVDGQRRIEPGDIHQPVFGSGDGSGVAEVVENKGAFLVKPSADDTGPGMDIHAKGIQFQQITESEFCVSCHQVAVHPGIKLEVVWEQYRASPAMKQGITCQDCHMGVKPGVALEENNYATYTEEMALATWGSGKFKRGVGKKHANHAFYGPGYPIAHPGIFPHNQKSEDFTPQQWLKFDYRAGWGTEEFEEKVDDGEIEVAFPEEWESADDRFDARDIITENLERLDEKRELRRQVMENGSRIDGPFFKGEPRAGKPLSFHYLVTNTNPGHNMPSGSLGAQPEIWLNVALIDPDGNNVWESGYVDSHGDMCDLHSLDVAEKKIKHDDQLFNLQTKFLTTNVKGTDREMYLPINMDIDQLPFIRPAGQPITVMNHPPFIRMEGRSLPPLGSREAKYKVPASALSKPGTYRLAVRLRSRAEPIYFMKFCGATLEMEQAMNEWMLDLHPSVVQFDVK
jgi:nitrate/TMAO reductase-like tetraheme cytochrome c subunit